jgi:hypothetical protein
LQRIQAELGKVVVDTPDHREPRDLQLGFAGYSYGGGLFWRTLMQLAEGYYPIEGPHDPQQRDPNWHTNYRTVVTAYMDAIKHGLMPGDFRGQAEVNLPPGSLQHWNLFQSHDQDPWGLVDKFQGRPSPDGDPDAQFDLDLPNHNLYGWKGRNFWGGAVPQPAAGDEDHKFTHAHLEDHAPLVAFLVNRFKIAFTRD